MESMNKKASTKPESSKSEAELKVMTSIRLDKDVIEELRGTGKGWQTRLNNHLREWLKIKS